MPARAELRRVLALGRLACRRAVRPLPPASVRTRRRHRGGSRRPARAGPCGPRCGLAQRHGAPALFVDALPPAPADAAAGPTRPRNRRDAARGRHRAGHVAQPGRACRERGNAGHSLERTVRPRGGPRLSRGGEPRVRRLRSAHPDHAREDRGGAKAPRGRGRHRRGPRVSARSTESGAPTGPGAPPADLARREQRRRREASGPLCRYLAGEPAREAR